MTLDRGFFFLLREVLGKQVFAGRDFQALVQSFAIDSDFFSCSVFGASIFGYSELDVGIDHVVERRKRPAAVDAKVLS